ncbi:amino acid ABC transporter ATP-binding protein [Leucobacter sp. CSA1]|uniref:Amino acid ABC transporter ATP-binding protein n=1 Tax=Leucobacter chromiisoli TaxID=2796471 RepID=A0A934Q943_9MICO|nr:amino acid ABC transporter ATP-binding protein [Leucobacter chromiisoli]MBK0419560.1 amino acid ABC transporter ATP-binding protein [Leucobacter chromiisoli]
MTATREDEQPLLEMRGVVKRYGDQEVLRDIGLTVRRGEVLALIGPSGSGKSTLLRSINQLERTDDGEILIGGELMGFRLAGGRLHELREEAICRQRLKTAMVFQQFNLFNHLTVLDNITLGPRRVLGMPRAAAEAEARRHLERVGLGHREQAYPRQLSGGQQQRVAIARGLSMRPDLMLFDEPTSALDPQLVGEVLGVIQDLAREDMTMLIVTHEIRFARNVADRVAFMEDGVIVECGPPEQVLDDPSDPRTRAFLREEA